MNPKYPIYIPTKSRWDSRITIRTLERMNVPYSIIVEEQQYEQYAKTVNENNILVLPKKYLDEYDTFDNLGDSKSKGPGAARNFAWDHSIEKGFDFHWVLDDNIEAFYRMNENVIWAVNSGTILRVMEVFVERYENIAMAGPNYEKFVISTEYRPPITVNTRIYSCNLIRNDVPYRWRGRYNEDTDLSLRMLKDGWCTVQFNAFLQGKGTTQRVRGGNTAEFYEKEGTLNKSKMLEDMHPDVAKVVWKFNRWHHYVDYRPFKKNLLVKKDDFNYTNIVNNYGMKLIEVSKSND